MCFHNRGGAKVDDDNVSKKKSACGGGRRERRGAVMVEAPIGSFCFVGAWFASILDKRSMMNEKDCV